MEDVNREGTMVSLTAMFVIVQRLNAIAVNILFDRIAVN